MKRPSPFSLAVVAALAWAPAEAVTVNAAFGGATAGGGTYTLFFTAELPGALPDSSFSAGTPGLENTLDLVIDGTPVFDESTASVFSLSFAGGQLERFSAGGDQLGPSFSIFNLPDFVYGLALDPLTFPSIQGFFDADAAPGQVVLLLPDLIDVEITGGFASAVVPLPAPLLLLASGLGALALVGRKAQG
ncbi:MAG: hypothetical protein AAGI34_13400 [Pseudomonadota bacterium]